MWKNVGYFSSDFKNIKRVKIFVNYLMANIFNNSNTINLRRVVIIHLAFKIFIVRHLFVFKMPRLQITF